MKGSSAELLVAYRFIAAGRRVSWPLVVCGYDLVVDSGDALFRIQVKSAAETMSGRYVRLQKTNPANGIRYAGRYDYLCAVASPNEIYVIPAGTLFSVQGDHRFVASINIGKASRFVPFLNQFNLGSGEFGEQVCSEITELATAKRANTDWFKSDPSQRKAHRRLTQEEVIALRTMPIKLFKNDPHCPDGIPIEQVAQQLDVHVATIRNLLRGKRKDLRKLDEGAQNPLDT